MCVCMCGCMYVCMYVYVYITCIYLCTHIHCMMYTCVGLYIHNVGRAMSRTYTGYVLCRAYRYSGSVCVHNIGAYIYITYRYRPIHNCVFFFFKIRSTMAGYDVTRPSALNRGRGSCCRRFYGHRSRCLGTDWRSRLKLIFLLVSMAIGIALGALLRHFPPFDKPGDNPRSMWYVFFPGEIFLRIISVLSVPLLLSSIISGVTSLRDFGKVGACAMAYYVGTTTLACAEGFGLAFAIRPGSNMTLPPPQDRQTAITNTDALLDLIRYVKLVYQYDTEEVHIIVALSRGESIVCGGVQTVRASPLRKKKKQTFRDFTGKGSWHPPPPPLFLPKSLISPWYRAPKRFIVIMKSALFHGSIRHFPFKDVN